MITIKITESQLTKVKRLIEQEEGEESRLLHGPYKCLEYTKMDIGDEKGKKMGKRFPLVFRYGNGERLIEFSNVLVGGIGEYTFQMIKDNLIYSVIGTFKCDDSTLSINDSYEVFVKNDSGTLSDMSSHTSTHINNTPTRGSFNSIEDFESTIKNIKWK